MKKKVFEKKVFEKFVFDGAFFVIVFGIFSYGMKVLSGYMKVVQDYTSQLGTVDETGFLSLFGEMSVVSNRAYYLMFFIAPVLIFAAYCIFQGLSFKKDWKYVRWFSVVSLVPFVVFLVMLNDMFSKGWVEVVFFVVFYVAFLLYLKPNFKKLGDRIWDYRNFLKYVAYVVLFALIICCLMMFYVSIKVSLVWILFLVTCLGLILLLSWFKSKLLKS
ncbi:MAG: hypothetical protein KKG60_02320 [Nanoarchaeota archaeon]|nr:hypothetical protein [Nanoarchaeota archaeon]